MKVKAYVFAIAAVLSVVSLILFLISAVSSGTSSIPSVILSGVLTSSLASLIIIIGEYFIIKRTAIEKLYIESEHIKKQIFKSIRYLAPLDLYMLNADKIKKSVKGYLGILEIGLDDLGFLFDDVLFVSEIFCKKGKRKKRLWIHKNIYELIYNYKKEVAAVSDELYLILNNPSLVSKGPCLKSFENLQKVFFNTSQGPAEKSVCVEQTYLKNIEESNSKLLEFISHEAAKETKQNYSLGIFMLP